MLHAAAGIVLTIEPLLLVAGGTAARIDGACYNGKAELLQPLASGATCRCRCPASLSRETTPRPSSGPTPQPLHCPCWQP
jgi:hypothetical protein